MATMGWILPAFLWFRSLSSTALFIFMNLCHYAFIKLLGEEGNLAEGSSVVSYQSCFFRKLSYLQNTNSFGSSHSHGECGLSPTKVWALGSVFKVTNCPVVLSLLLKIFPNFAVFPGQLLYTMENVDIILPAVKIFQQKKRKRKINWTVKGAKTMKENRDWIVWFQ